VCAAPVVLHRGSVHDVSALGGQLSDKKHLKNVGPIRHCSRRIAIHQVSLLSHAATVARRLRIDVHNNNDNNDNA